MHKNQCGSILIEAVVAILVLAVGTFGVVKLNTVLLKGGGESKTRAEALQIAQSRIEALMTEGAMGSCPTAGSTSATTETNAITGINASYRVGQDKDNATAERFNAAVYVAWDGSSDPRSAGASQQIILRTIVACGTAGTSGQVGGDANTLNSPKIKTPTGVARVGGRANPCGTVTPPCIAVGVLAASTGMAQDGLRVLTTGNSVELFDPAANRVLLTIDDGSLFSSITGRVYIQTSNSGAPIVAAQGSDAADPSDDRVFVLSSDAAYCSRVFPADSAIPSGTSGSARKYVYFDYNCYVSKGWWGNIGIVQVGTAQQSDKVCVGDMGVSSSETNLFSRKAALSATRGYRGFRNNGADGSTNLLDYETVGIGYTLTSGSVSTSYAAVHIGSDRTQNHHDFLLATISGQNTCEGSGVMTRLTDDTASANQFTSNVGKFFCMAQCPPLTPSTSTQTTVIRGTITRVAGAELKGIDTNDCQSSTWTEGDLAYTYTCTKSWTGFAGSSWQGGVSFIAEGTKTICTNSSGSQPIVTPSGLFVASTVNNRLATAPNQNTITFTDVQLGVTNIEINLDVRDPACPTLGTPNVTWNASNLLSWPAISNATSYDVYECILEGNATSCTPTTRKENILSGSNPMIYTPLTPSGGTKGACYGFAAKGSFDPSAVSAAKCLLKSGNTTSYY